MLRKPYRTCPRGHTRKPITFSGKHCCSRGKLVAERICVYSVDRATCWFLRVFNDSSSQEHLDMAQICSSNCHAKNVDANHKTKSLGSDADYIRKYRTDHTHKNVAKHYLWQKSVTQCNEGSKTDGSRPRNCSRGRLTVWIHSSANLRWGSSLMARLATTRICSSLDWRTPLQTTSHILPPITTKAREAGSSSADGARGWQMKTKRLKHCIELGHQKTKMNAIKYGLGNKE